MQHEKRASDCMRQRPDYARQYDERQKSLQHTTQASELPAKKKPNCDVHHSKRRRLVSHFTQASPHVGVAVVTADIVHSL